MDFAGEDDLLGFWYSWSNSGQMARRRWFESPEGDFCFFLLPMCMSRHVWGATRAAVRPRFLRASQGCVVVCVYEYEIILSTIFPEIFPEKRVCSAGNGFRKNGYGPLEILSYAKTAGVAW